ncbi:WSC domain protein [Lentithecium fluviatile CBS 122367]|uniref:WSC domain protein n=1 Tax=Lentithecium fluviatile CBS 122367 TaxID=1168545 RepID=A0A6G1IH07_9PLEO|nr:WSC domain protein [Lentithecium fluviatile CBS 122367]
MKFTSILLFLVALAHQATSTGVPELQWDPDTVKDCVEWYNNTDNESCESVRKLFGITPEEFHSWNPSLGLDCKPWRWQSYCIVTQEKLDKTKPTTTPTTTSATPTTSTSSLGPSPTAWTALGCYTENSKVPLLEKNMSPTGGDPALTIPKCKNSCYRRAYRFAGVQQGNQCWCGTYVGGEWSKNQTDCNTPCTGDKNTFCGGKGFENIFKG